MYCPECGGFIKNNKCVDCKQEIDKELLAFSCEEQESQSDKLACLFSYICWPISKLFKINNKSNYKFHSNQGFSLFWLEVLTIASAFIPKIGLPALLFFSVLTGFLLYKGINNVLKNDKEKLPIIGDFTFLK